MPHDASLSPCLLCGRMIFDSEVSFTPSWLNQFRILYSFEDVISITGVGYYREGSFNYWVASPDYNTRWDDEGYEEPEDDLIGVLTSPPQHGRWGFPFHEACWSLLEAAIAPEPVPLRRLFDLCRSFPMSESEYAPNWGHYYGGLDRGHPDNGLCVEVGGDSDEYTSHHRLCLTQIAKLNPFHIPELERPPVWQERNVPGMNFANAQIFNLFVWLPHELLFMIAAQLPTRDYLNMRLASRSFIPLFHDRNFWATRFGPGSERSWVFESRQWDRAIDWQQLYRDTSCAHRSPAMHNRERVWLLAQYVRRLLEPRFASPESTSLLLADPGDSRTAGAEVRSWNANDPYEDFPTGCVSLYRSASFKIPLSIDRISFFFNCLGEAQYVVGLKVVGMCGAVVELGYIAEETAVSVSGKRLTGLRLALEQTGIRAVQCVFDNDIDTPWIGSPANAGQTNKLVSSGRLGEIYAHFDGCRIVRLGVTSSEWKPASVRDTAVWQEGIPDRQLQLNEAFFSVLHADDDFYDPIYWSVFGGTRGQSLGHLTAIQTYMTSTPCGIEFWFTPGYLDYIDTCGDLGVFPDSELAALQRFSINGPGGERISGVDLYLSHDSQDGGLHDDAGAELESYKFGDCITALGVITEMLD
ncbi:hypothetical protein V2A60_000803 [Cordyceps javanica]|nr:F-box domain containing protein [Cordyceps javanica]